jgi:GT2 family glycosyltransferase
MDWQMNIVTIIVSFNGENFIDKCLKSVLASTVLSEIIVVDNASDDRTKEIINTEYNNVLLIENERNLGFGAANNQGIRIALEKNADFIFLLNQDAEIETDTVEKLIRHAIKIPDMGIMSPLHIDPLSHEPERNFSDFTGIKSINDIRNILEAGKVLQFFDFVNAAAWLLPKQSIELIGGFNPSFFHYGEDSNYAARVKYHGLLCAVAVDSTIYHSTCSRADNPFNSDKFYIYQKQLTKKLSDPNKRYFIACEILKRILQIIYCLFTFDLNKMAYYRELLKIIKNMEFKSIQKNRQISMQKGSSFLH